MMLNKRDPKVAILQDETRRAAYYALFVAAASLASFAVMVWCVAPQMSELAAGLKSSF